MLSKRKVLCSVCGDTGMYYELWEPLFSHDKGDVSFLGETKIDTSPKEFSLPENSIRKQCGCICKCPAGTKLLSSYLGGSFADDDNEGGL